MSIRLRLVSQNLSQQNRIGASAVTIQKLNNQAQLSTRFHFSGYPQVKTGGAYVVERNQVQKTRPFYQCQRRLSESSETRFSHVAPTRQSLFQRRLWIALCQQPLSGSPLVHALTRVAASGYRCRGCRASGQDAFFHGSFLPLQEAEAEARPGATVPNSPLLIQLSGYLGEPVAEGVDDQLQSI